MPDNQLILKKSTVAGKAPTITDLKPGELAINLADRRLYFKAKDPGGSDVIDYFEAVPPEATSGGYSEVIASYVSEADPLLSAVVSSYGVAADQIGTVTGGWNNRSRAETDARRWQLDSYTGNAQLAGRLTTSAPFQDYAELFENKAGTTIPLGTLVTLDGEGVRPAQGSDQVVGIVSATAGVALGDTPFAWQGKYLRGEFGELIYEDVEHVRWDDENGGYTGPSEGVVVPAGVTAEYFIASLPKISPDYDPTLPNAPRSERPDEWTNVGMIGQIHARVTEHVIPGDYVKPTTTPGRGGKASTRTNIRCMKITQPFDSAKGYAVALCLVK